MTKWMRIVFLITGVVNMIGAWFFVPRVGFGRALLGLPVGAHPLYLWMIASWIFLFGLAYFYLSIMGKSEKLFVAVGAFAKLCFGLLLIVYWLNREASMWAVLAALTDITLAGIFCFGFIKPAGLVKLYPVTLFSTLPLVVFAMGL
jgi:hypothetical protein